MILIKIMEKPEKELKMNSKRIPSQKMRRLQKIKIQKNQNKLQMKQRNRLQMICDNLF